MRSLISIFLFSFIVIAIVSCTEPVDRINVPGKYIYSDDMINDYMIIKNDGTFSHYYQLSSHKRILIEEGLWKYEGDQYKSEIIFSNLKSVSKDFGPELSFDYAIVDSPRMEIFEVDGLIKLCFIREFIEYYKEADSIKTTNDN